MTTKTMLCVGGPAHGKILTVEDDNSTTKFVEQDMSNVVSIDPTRGMSNTHMPIKEHTYIPRKLLSRSQSLVAKDWRSSLPGHARPRTYKVLVHDSLQHAPLIQLEFADAVLESGMLDG